MSAPLFLLAIRLLALTSPRPAIQVFLSTMQLRCETCNRPFQDVELLAAHRESCNSSGNMATIAAGTVGAAVGGVAAPVVVTSAVSAIGFTSTGIAAGSTAASMMSAAAIANGGGVAAGSTVAVLQSVGAVGLGALAWPVALGGAVVVGGICCAVAYNRYKQPATNNEPMCAV